MQKSLTIGIQLLAAGMMLLGTARAQTPAATATPSTQPATPAQTPKAPAAKKPAVTTKAATPLTLKTQREKASYAVGMSYGSALHQRGVPVDAALVARGLRDAMSGAKSLLSDDEMKAVLTQLQSEVHQQQAVKEQAATAKAHEAGAPNRQAGDAFLAANKAKDGVVTLPSGLQYKILTAGTGPKPTANDTVSCNYRGALINGTEFDSSTKHGGPASFPVGRVIPGWTEALQLMPVGSKWQLFIPPGLAYGDNAPPEIGPGSTLVFEVELLSIAEAKK